MGAHILLPLAVNSKSERKVDSLPRLGLEPLTFGTLAHLSDRSAKSHSILFIQSFIHSIIYFIIHLYIYFVFVFRVPEFGTWGFSVKRGRNLLDIWNRIPSDTDILITHTPPCGQFIIIFNTNNNIFLLLIPHWGSFYYRLKREALVKVFWQGFEPLSFGSRG
jgi:hypothetical protein